MKIKWLEAKDDFCWLYDYNSYTDKGRLEEPRPVWSRVPVDVVNAEKVFAELETKGYKVKLIP